MSASCNGPATQADAPAAYPPQSAIAAVLRGPRAADYDREPGHQLAVHRAGEALPGRRRPGERRDRAERRPSEFFVPVAKPKKASAQLALQFGGGTAPAAQRDHQRDPPSRRPMAHSRATQHTTATRRSSSRTGAPTTASGASSSARSRPPRPRSTLSRPPRRSATRRRLNVIRAENARLNAGLPRLAFKMATGSGKTVVMAMLIAWQALNKLANPQDRRFADTLPDRHARHHDPRPPPGAAAQRSRQLLPVERDLVTPEQLERLQAATIVITNYHAFIRRETDAGGRADQEGPRRARRRHGRGSRRRRSEMVRRVCRVLGQREEHRRPQRRGPPLLPLRRRESRGRDARAPTSGRRRSRTPRRPASGSTACGRSATRSASAAIYDLSATPFFLQAAPAIAEGTLFPWVVSDFGLMDAIESGIVKVPRVPVSDDSMTGDLPTLPRPVGPRPRRPARARAARTRRDRQATRVLPKELEGALRSLYADYERSYHEWAGAGTRHAAGLHRRLLEHQRQQARLRLDRGLGQTAARTATTVARARQACPLQQRRGRRRWLDRPEQPADRLGAARVAASRWTRRSRRSPRPRSRSSSASTSPASRAAALTRSPTRTSCARS